MINLFDDELNADGEHCFGEELGAALWSRTIYEVAPGKRICPYHWHFGEEEWLLVVSGTPTLRTPEGKRVLEPWDVAVFVTGEAGAHELRNESGETVRVLMLSNLSDPAVTVYPDSGKVGVLAGWSRKDGQTVRLRNRPEANLDYWDGEER